MLTDRTQGEVSVKKYIAIDGDEIFIGFQEGEHNN